MKKLNRINIKILTMVLLLTIVGSTQNNNSLTAQTNLPERIPHLRKQGNTTQLIVEGKPFIVLGGELGNSTFTSVEYMAPFWSDLKTMNLNTILAPVYWELIEPTEGENEFYIAGSGITATFKNGEAPGLITGILKNEEGRFENNQWIVTRHLNGDQTHQGRHIRIFRHDFSIQRLELYNYE